MASGSQPPHSFACTVSIAQLTPSMDRGFIHNIFINDGVLTRVFLAPLLLSPRLPMAISGSAPIKAFTASMASDFRR